MASSDFGPWSHEALEDVGWLWLHHFRASCPLCHGTNPALPLLPARPSGGSALKLWQGPKAEAGGHRLCLFKMLSPNKPPSQEWNMGP